MYLVQQFPLLAVVGLLGAWAFLAVGLVLNVRSARRDFRRMQERARRELRIATEGAEG